MPKKFLGQSKCCGAKVTFKDKKHFCFKCDKECWVIPSKWCRVPGARYGLRSLRVGNVN